jgi:hypothetical protein
VPGEERSAQYEHLESDERMVGSGRKDTVNRLEKALGGAWGSSSQDYIRVCSLLFSQSATYAKNHKGNVSPFVLAGIPLLFAALRALLIECASQMYGWSRSEDRIALSRLANDPNELGLLKDRYALSDDLLQRLAMLYEIRNEMIHPSHRPSGTPDQTPEYLRPLKQLGVLQSSGSPDSDYPWMAQLQSHRLFIWAFSCIEEVATVLIHTHYEDREMAEAHVASYSRFRQVEPS